MISINPKFTKAEIKEILQRQKAKIEEALFMRLKRIGEEFIRDARDNGSYKDRTGNLRASIGYAILKDRKIIHESFPGATKAGSAAAKKAIEDYVMKFPTGFALVGVAGMNYAASVEAKGYDVITTSAIKAEENLIIGLKNLTNKIR